MRWKRKPAPQSMYQRYREVERIERWDDRMDAKIELMKEDPVEYYIAARRYHRRRPLR
jgi:hypothetical protein